MSAINPFEKEFQDRPLWCVYGPDSFPTMFCCKVTQGRFGASIWGYSVYRRQPGFRTLGRSLAGWSEENGAKFFAEQEHALAYLAALTKPKVKK